MNKRILSILLTVCMMIGCMAVGVYADNTVVASARGSKQSPIQVYRNYADDSKGSVTLDVGGTVSDDGVLTFYDYGTVKSKGFIYMTAESNNEKVATVKASTESGTLKLAFTGVSDGVATITVDYSCTTYGGSDSIYGEHSGAATGKLYYTVTVGNGGSAKPSGGLQKDTQGRYVIYNQADLEAVANEMDASYIVANNIVLSGNWTPLGWTDSTDVPFTGTFDGNGYTISNFSSQYESGAECVGLFAINNGTVENLTINVSNIYADRYVGAVAGKNNGRISHVTVTQDDPITVDAISANGVKVYSSTAQMYLYESYVGGIAGINYGTIEACDVAAQVVGYTYVGGITGKNEEKGRISETAFSGGTNTDYKNTDETSLFNYTGGLVGMNNGSINDCYVNAATDLVGGTAVGGAVGGNASMASVSNVWVDVQGKITYRSNAGLFFGANNAPDSKLGQNFIIHTTNTGSTTGAKYIKPENMRNQESFKMAASDWDWENVWTYSAGENENYPVLRNCGNSGEHEDIVLPEKCTVSFEEGGLDGDTVSNMPAAYSVDHGTEINLPAAPTRTNDNNWVYDFQGWSDGAKTYSVGDPYTVNANVTFTATWRLHSVDGDGDWDRDDAVLIMDYLGGKVTLTDEQKAVADYNEDGKISFLDARRIIDVMAGNN